MRWEVKGADLSSGEDRSVVIEARDRAGAEQEAALRRIAVESITQIADPPPISYAAPQASNKGSLVKDLQRGVNAALASPTIMRADIAYNGMKAAKTLRAYSKGFSFLGFAAWAVGAIAFAAGIYLLVKAEDGLQASTGWAAIIWGLSVALSGGAVRAVAVAARLFAEMGAMKFMQDK